MVGRTAGGQAGPQAQVRTRCGEGGQGQGQHSSGGAGLRVTLVCVTPGGESALMWKLCPGSAAEESLSRTRWFLARMDLNEGIAPFLSLFRSV